MRIGLIPLVVLFIACSSEDDTDPIIQNFTVNAESGDTVQVEINELVVAELLASDDTELHQARLHLEFAGQDSFRLESFESLSVINEWNETEIQELTGKEMLLSSEFAIAPNSVGDWLLTGHVIDAEGNDSSVEKRWLRISNANIPAFQFEGTVPELVDGVLQVTQLSQIQLLGSVVDMSGLDSLKTVLYHPGGDSLLSATTTETMSVTDYDLSALEIDIPATEATTVYLTLVAYDADQLVNAYSWDVQVVD